MSPFFIGEAILNTPNDVYIRTEAETDHASIQVTNQAAFETPTEAHLVDKLREQAQPVISLVTVSTDRIVGHILFSPVTLAGHPELKIMGLAPMAVMPAHQRTGIGNALVLAGLEQCRKSGFGGVSHWAIPNTIHASDSGRPRALVLIVNSTSLLKRSC